MNYERFSGLMWGVMVGFCLTFGIAVEPKMIICTIFPLFGCWVFSERKEQRR